MKPTIALFVNHPECSVDCCNGIIRALSSVYDFKLFTRDWVEEGFFDDVDIVAFPGGFGDSDRFDRLLEKNKLDIIKFLRKGGRYLGICMGAYWADKNYFDILTDVRVVQYIRQPNTDTHRPHAKAMPVTWKNQLEHMYFYDGCAFTGNYFQTVATYPNGDPMAIIQGKIGLIGCHPESLPSWYNKPYLLPHWHNYAHHTLLLEFVNELMSR